MHKFLIVVDMQNDFITGSLGSAQARQIVGTVAARILAAAQNGEQVIFTLDTHAPDYLDTHEGKLLPVEHCVRGSDGWQLNHEIQSAADGCKGAQRIEKPVFGSITLMQQLSRYALENGLISGMGMEIELCGVCTDICVISNALMLRSALTEAEISVNSTLCAGVTPQKHATALDAMASCQINVIE